ncbi:MAG: hypothetical protein LC643_06400 [Bacteroidales bacterium]|nr:hypothetical protein [Bacteroidales bacterium]
MEVTPRAIQELTKMLDSANAPAWGFRVQLQPGPYSPKPEMLITEKPDEGDYIRTIETLTFCMDKETYQEISGYIIDFSVNGFKLDFMLPSGRCCR